MLKVQDGSIGNVIFHNITRLEKLSQLQNFTSLLLVQNEDIIDLWLTTNEPNAIKDLIRYYERYYNFNLANMEKKIIRLEK
jgi:hypothetical protein